MPAIQRMMVAPPAELDVGVGTLEAFENARRYNGWIRERIQETIGRRVLEVGSGIGNIISEILSCPNVESVVATDLSAASLATLRDRLGHDERLSTEVWDASKPAPPTLAPGSFDTVICSNVLEHIEHHVQAAAQ
ncbi:MAG: class I SAM-dependent methyltransferase, partial [Planctomycetaceae bacterium]